MVWAGDAWRAAGHPQRTRPAPPRTMAGEAPRLGARASGGASPSALPACWGAWACRRRSRGRGIGTVVREPRELPEGSVPEGMKQVLRIATEDDIQLAARNKTRERDAYSYCLKKIAERGLEMKLVRLI